MISSYTADDDRPMDPFAGSAYDGVAKLEKDGFRGAVIDAVDAIVG